MKSFYSIIKLSPNIATEDSVAIGLLLCDGKKFRYYFSNKRKKLATRLLDDKEVDLNFIINQMVEKFDEINIHNDELKVFYKFENLSQASYFEYLNSYSHGILQFSKPKGFFEEVTEKSFEKLTRFLFPEPVEEKIHTIDDFSKTKKIIQRQLIGKVQGKVHTNYNFTSKLFPSIYFSYEMDCIGLNGSLIGAKSLSFEKSLQVIDKNISHYFTLISSLSSKFNKALKENNFYLISEEPKTIGGKEHKLWESVKYNELIDVIDPEESNKVADLILEKKANKFLSESE